MGMDEAASQRANGKMDLARGGGGDHYVARQSTGALDCAEAIGPCQPGQVWHLPAAQGVAVGQINGQASAGECYGEQADAVQPRSRIATVQTERSADQVLCGTGEP